MKALALFALLLAATLPAPARAQLVDLQVRDLETDVRSPHPGMHMASRDRETDVSIRH